MQFRIVHVRIETFGKAPAKYGPNAYKVGASNGPFLVRAGWTHCGKGRSSSSYEYVSPPHGTRGSNPTISIQVPTDEEILAIAMRMHQEHVKQIDKVEGFLVYYRPAGEELPGRIMERYLFMRNFPWGQRLAPEPRRFREFSEVTFGVDAPWSVDLIWDRGDDDTPTWRRHEQHVVTSEGTI